MSSNDPFTLGLGPSSSSVESDQGRSDGGAADEDPPLPDEASLARADRLAKMFSRTGRAAAGGQNDDLEACDPVLLSSQQSFDHGSGSEAMELPEGTVGGAGGRPFTDFVSAESKAKHLTSHTGDQWWVRALSASQYVLVCAASSPLEPSARRIVEADSGNESGEDFRTKPLDELQLSDFPDGHPVHRFGLGQYKRFAKRNFRFKPSYRSMWPLFVLAGIGGVFNLMPVSVITLLPDDAVYQLLETFSEAALVDGVGKFGLLLVFVGVGKALFQRHYRRYYLMPGFAKAEEGIIARKSTKISYTNIVNYDVHQNPIARILNYGTLELSSAGSDGAEIDMHNLFSPRVVELVLESRMEESRQVLRR